MEGHDNMQQPTGGVMNEVNQAVEKGEKRVTLDIDIWYLVFKQVVKIYKRRGQSFKKWLLPFRLLSRDFYDVITPIVYYHVNLASGSRLIRLASKREPLVAEKFVENISNHAREMVLDSYDIYYSSELEFQTAAAKLVAECKHLKSLVWEYSDQYSQEQLASLYLHSFLQNTRGCHFFTNIDPNRCYIQKLNLGKKNKTDDSKKGKDTTTSPESSQTLPNRLSDLRLRSTSTTEIKASLGQRKSRPEPEALVLDLTQAEFSTFESFRARFPAMERLTLKGYTWDHAQSNFEQVWNFSRLRSLSLKGSVVEFLKDAPINELAQLHFLRLSGFPDFGPRFNDGGSVQKLLRVLLEGLKELNKLVIEDSDWDICTPMDAVFALGSNLKRLDLIQNQCFSFVCEGRELRLISVTDLVQLRISCPNLASLCLNLSVFSRDVSVKLPIPSLILALETMTDSSKVEEFLAAISQFEQLRTLTLQAVSSLAPQGVSNSRSDDADYDGARTIMAKLHAQKVGVQYDWIELHLQYNIGYSFTGEPKTDFRSFTSKISVSGVYTQWGSQRKIAPKVAVGSASRGNLGGWW